MFITSFLAELRCKQREQAPRPHTGHWSGALAKGGALAGGEGATFL
jgi:hypothetical protein